MPFDALLGPMMFDRYDINNIHISWAVEDALNCDRCQWLNPAKQVKLNSRSTSLCLFCQSVLSDAVWRVHTHLIRSQFSSKIEQSLTHLQCDHLIPFPNNRRACANPTFLPYSGIGLNISNKTLIWHRLATSDSRIGSLNLPLWQSSVGQVESLEEWAKELLEELCHACFCLHRCIDSHRKYKSCAIPVPQGIIQPLEMMLHKSWAEGV